MSPNLGQGAGTAMTSGLRSQTSLTDSRTFASALRVWEASERPTVLATQRYSRLYGLVGTRWPPALADARSALVWGIGRSAGLQRQINVAAHHTELLYPPRRPEVPLT